MMVGQTFALEPLLSLGSIEFELWDDNYTFVTADGSLSAQFEHTLLITKTGVEILTKAFSKERKSKVGVKTMASKSSVCFTFGSLALIVIALCPPLSLVQSSELKSNYYATSCPRVEDIVKEQVYNLYQEHGYTAVFWIRAIFHDCMVESCDASVLLDLSGSVMS
ncbi:hypothetical protein SUGI_0207110 [Cryptomeria japonica]|nr:hypothetical protein SUGI_0207110 [Cryptomeria japonica]